ncbi:Cacna1h [Symbiodinium pilosum]|uniref:Cacna1h protein n=1 Tax=Symbiodinium pilosum TaxID=2952 RepID=A0A812SX78_SYMPI|nr:Cacna1h [Symbiodinium pilosum]
MATQDPRLNSLEDDESVGSYVETESSSSSSQDDRKASQVPAHAGSEQENFTDGFWFCSAVALVCLTNLFALGIEVDNRCQSTTCNDANSYFDIINTAFTAIFVLDVGIRILMTGPKLFFLGQPSRDLIQLEWVNCADFLLVLLRVVDVWLLSPFGVVSNLKFASAFRIFHVFRAVRQVQLNASFRELWLVISALGETMWTLFWVGVMIIGVIWVAGILVRMAVSDRKPEEFNLDRSEWDFEEYWGTVLRSSYSLFQVITRDRWSDSLVWPLVETNPSLMVVFICFLTVASLSLMNSVIGVVVESTLSSARATAAREQKVKEKVDAQVLQSMREIFEAADTDKSGKLDKDELQALFRNHRVRDRLKLLQLPFKDLEMLFDILDDDNGGNINTDRFFRGVERLRGQAAASDLHQMNVDLNKRLKWCDSHQKEVTDLNDHLAELLDAIDDMDGNIVRSDVDEKDPVLMAKRVRQKFVKSEQLRGKNFRKGHKPPEAYNPWEEMRRKEVMARRLEKRRLEDEDKIKRKEAEKAAQRRAFQEEREKRAERKQAQKSQPPPPPLPHHLQRVREQQQMAKEKRRIEKLRRRAAEEKKRDVLGHMF